MKDFITTVRAGVISIVVCCVIYPAVVWMFGRLTSPAKAEGSLLRDSKGQVIGSTLIAQPFTRPQYFWPRPSAADYNAAAAAGSNLSPTSPRIRQRAREILEQLGLKDNRPVPADLLTASGSGLDPHISLSSALLQVPRIAQARALPDGRIEQLIRQSTDSKSLEWFGAEPIVNVLKLNRTLDSLVKESR